MICSLWVVRPGSKRPTITSGGVMPLYSMSSNPSPGSPPEPTTGLFVKNPPVPGSPDVALRKWTFWPSEYER